MTRRRSIWSDGDRMIGLAHICRIANNAIRLAAEQPLVWYESDDPSGQCAYRWAYASEATVDDDGDLVGSVTHTDDCMWSLLAKGRGGRAGPGHLHSPTYMGPRRII